MHDENQSFPDVDKFNVIAIKMNIFPSTNHGSVS